MDSAFSWFVLAVIGAILAIKLFKNTLSASGDEWKTWRRETQEDDYLTWCEVDDWGKKN